MTGMTLTSVAVTPANPSIALGFNQVFVATGTFSDGSTQNITSQAVWATSNPAVASITDDPIGAGLATAGVAGTTTITARVDSSTGIPLTAGAVSGSTTLTVNAATLIAISVLPQNSTQLEGSTRAYSAIGVFSDGSTQNITAQVDWSSSDPAVVRVSTTGTTRGAGTASGPGSATVSAQAANGVTGTSAVQVLGNSTSLVAIAVAPDPATVGVGNVIALKATGAFTDGSTADITAAVTWSSAAPGIAVVSNATGANGTVTGLQAGATTVTATAANSSISATIPLTVSATAIEALYIAPPAVSIPFNAHRQYVATAVFNDGSSHDFMTEVTWSSSTGTVAAISNAAGSQGLVTPSGPGSTTITAVVPGTSISATTPLTVTNPAAIAMDIMPTSAAVALGTTKSFHAFVTFADGSRTEMMSQVTWNSAQPDVLSVVSGGAGAGTATGVSSGTATLSAALPGTAISASTSIAVSNAQILLVATTTTGASGTPSNLSSYLIDPATGRWSSSKRRRCRARPIRVSGSRSASRR
jgi:trimeric autotransporter adhesin